MLLIETDRVTQTITIIKKLSEISNKNVIFLNTFNGAVAKNYYPYHIFCPYLTDPAKQNALLTRILNGKSY